MYKLKTIWLFLLTVCSDATKKILRQENGIADHESKSWNQHIDRVKCGNRWMYKHPPKWETCTSNVVQQLLSPCDLVTDNWILPYGVNLVYVNIRGGASKCAYIKKQEPTIKKCTDNYVLKAYLGDRSVASPYSYKTLSNIPKKSVDAFPKSDFYKYNVTIPITVTGKKYLKLLFESKYFCGNINGLGLYYYNCPSSSNELVKFNEKPAPSGPAPEMIHGFCVENSETRSLMPYMLCYSNGTSTVHGKCDCKAGYQPVNKECQACRPTEYKSSSGNYKCKKCGKKSSSGKLTGASCRCEKYFFRARGLETNYSTECYKPPDAPSKIQVSNLTDSHVKISWKAPNHGSQALGIYIIKCINCPRDEEIKLNTNKTYINITRLKSFAPYNFSLCNQNGVTSLIGEHRCNMAYFNFTTAEGGKPGMIRNLAHTVNSDGSVTLIWDPPFNKGAKYIQYVVLYGDQERKTSKMTFTINTGTEDVEYVVKIYAQATVKGRKMEGDTFIYSVKLKIKGGIPLTLTVAVAACVIVLVVVVLLSGFCIWKKRHPTYLQVVRMENGQVQLPSKLFGHGKLYVDPTTYNAVDEAVQDFTTEIDRKDLKIGELLGGGEFAEVFKGTLFKNGMHKDVAIKTLKSSGAVSKRDRDDFFGEAAILGQFSDCPNVIKLEGVVLKDRPNLIILEYMSNGALDSYLQRNDMQFDITQLLGMARCVANGMTYLSEIGFIHRDLAARNILVDEYNICKVSDFGMSREIKIDDTYATQGGKIPVRWTAPEAIHHKKFTSASDIWSYGILLWEIMSFGERPYWDWGNYTVLERLQAGYRLPPPMNCPKVIHDLMLKCWHKERTKRPKFKEIGDQIEQWIRTPLLLREIASVIIKKDENLDYTVLETINKWLEAIGMDRYTDTFLNNDYSTPRQVLNLTMEDLEKLEIGPIGHRKKIYKAIQNTKDQVDASRNSAGGRAKKYSLSRKK